MFQAQLGDVSSFLLYNYYVCIMNMKIIKYTRTLPHVSAQAQASAARRLLPMHHNMCITFFMIITCMVFIECMVIIDHHT